jgi:trk system potassium uptake protein TrkA
LAKQRIAVLGLGRFGRSLVQHLAGKVELVVVDRDPAKVEAIARADWKPDCPVRFDTTDRTVMEQFVRGVDVCVVAFGENIQASLLTTLIVSQPAMNVKSVVARALDEEHAQILRAILRTGEKAGAGQGQSRVIQPEQEAGEHLARSLLNPDLESLVEAEEGPSIFALRAQRALHGLSVWGRDLEATLLLVSRTLPDGTEDHFVPKGDTVIEPGDSVCFYGSEQARELIEEAGLFAAPTETEAPVRKVAIVGLGRFGRAVHSVLQEQGGVELIVLDRNEKRAREVGGCMVDASSEAALREAGVDRADACVVCIGKDDFNAAVLATRAVANLGVKTILTRAQTEEQAQILQAILAERKEVRSQVIQPEREAGQHQARWLVYPGLKLYAPAGPGLVVVDVRVPHRLSGRTLQDLALPPRFNFRVVQIQRGPEDDQRRFKPGARTAVLEGDVLRLLGPEKNLTFLLEEITADEEQNTRRSTFWNRISRVFRRDEG